MRKKISLIAVVAIFGLAAVFFCQAEDADISSPAAISDLSASGTTASSTVLGWAAPGDDGSVGTSTLYDLRYSTANITESDFSSSTPVSGLPLPKIAGTAQTKVVGGLSASTTYYFAIKTKDEADNWSGLSNIAIATTLSIASPPTPPATTTPADVEFEVQISPETLNLASQGRWITAHLFMKGYKASDIDVSSVKLNGTLSPDPSFRGVNFFSPGNGNKERNSSNLVLKFSRAAFIQLAGNQTGPFTVTLTGNAGTKTFSASDTVELIAETPEGDGSVISSTSSPEVYLIKNGKKRHIPSPEAFGRLGLDWTRVKKLSLEELGAYLEDDLVKTPDSPAVYILCKGKKRHIPSAEVFSSYGFDWADISVIAGAELADYPDAQLIREAGAERVYQLLGGKKSWVKSISSFNKHGFRWDDVIIINQTESGTIPEGENLD